MKLPNLTDAEFEKVRKAYPVGKACPTCDDKLVYLLDGKEVSCNCNQQKLLQKHYFAANIGRRYHTLGIEDLDTPDAAKVKPMVAAYLDKFADSYAYGLGFVMWGGMGTGKTLVACHILKELIKKGYRGYFIQFDDLIDTWGKRWSDDVANRQLEESMKRAGMLVIDDLSTDKRNIDNFLSSGLEAVVRFRYNQSLPTIVTTNLTQDKQMIEFPRVFSLLSAVNTWIEMESKVDYRPYEYRDRIHLLSERQERIPII